MGTFARTRLPYALIALGLLAPVTVAVVYSVNATGAPRSIPPGWLLAARIGLPLCATMALAGVVLAWRGAVGTWRLALVVVAAALLLSMWAMFFA